MIESRVAAADLYTDVSGLNNLKGQARSDKDGALREVARQFESLLLSQVLKSMRAANKTFSEGNFLQSNQTEFYEEMFDSQLTLALTKGRSLGLADAMVRQMSPEGDESGRVTGATLDIRDYARSLPALKRELPARLQEVVELEEAGAEIAAPEMPMPQSFGSPAEFVSRLLPVAQEVAEELGVDPRVLVAQAALETGWGKHMIEGKDGTASHNLFGIKADGRWSGDSVNITTTEFREGVPLKESAAFRAYSGFDESFADYVEFLKVNPRYRQALESANDPTAFTQALQDAGYATDPNYSQKIQTIIDGKWIQSALELDGKAPAQ
ncbi:MAG: flagellar assembly peptidoglycan hydrolase FlgJ [Alteromonadaceae bacterium]|nr:flagellar assembly peptidoglycan hydrolase FlgJ [Alteromonadaceae bacterium]